MAAREDFRDIVDFEAIKIFEDIEGVLEGEGEVIVRVDDQGALGGCGKAIHVGHGADDREDLSDLSLIQA